MTQYIITQIILGSLGGILTLALGVFCILIYKGIIGKSRFRKRHIFWFGVMMCMTGVWALFEVWNEQHFFFGLELVMTYVIGVTLPLWFYIFVQSLKQELYWNTSLIGLILIQIGVVIWLAIPDFGIVEYIDGVGVLRLQSLIHSIFLVYMLIVSGIGLISLYNITRTGAIEYSKGILIAVTIPFGVVTITNMIIPYIWADNSYHRIGPLALTFLTVYISYIIIKEQALRIPSLIFQVYALITVFIVNIGIQLSFMFFGIIDVFQPERMVLIGILGLIGGILMRQIIKGAQEEKLILITQAKLRHSIEEKDQFLHISSHQLRTPFTAVKGYMQLLSDSSSYTKPEYLQEYLQKMKSVIQNISSVTEDILNINTIQSGEFILNNTDTINLGEYIQHILDSKLFLLEKLGITHTLTYTGKKFLIQGDAVKIREMLHNGIDNAIQYTKDRIYIKVIAHRKDIEIQILDNGIGVTKSEQKSLFRPYQRGDYAQSVRREGTGLGLYLMKTIITYHQGTIEMASPGRNKGTCLVITLPKLLK
jgi:signal transduction histidine kinase